MCALTFLSPWYQYWWWKWHQKHSSPLLIMKRKGKNGKVPRFRWDVEGEGGGGNFQWNVRLWWELPVKVEQAKEYKSLTSAHKPQSQLISGCAETEEIPRILYRQSHILAKKKMVSGSSLYLNITLLSANFSNVWIFGLSNHNLKFLKDLYSLLFQTCGSKTSSWISFTFLCTSK